MKKSSYEQPENRQGVPYLHNNWPEYGCCDRGVFQKNRMNRKLPVPFRLKLKIICDRVVSIIYPRTCPGCGRILKSGNIRWSALLPDSDDFLKKDPFICDECAAKLEFCAGRPVCMKCSKPLEDERDEYCRDCRMKIRHFDRGAAALIHNETARQIMYDLKYSHLRVNCDFAAFEMEKAVLNPAYLKTEGSGDPEIFNVDAIIPVPLHRKRLIERGYNQAEQIAGTLELFLEIAGHEPIPVDSSYLIRKRRSSRLKELSGQQRTEELAGAFAVGGEPGKYRRVLLIDDIFTTGATLNECAKTLRAAGVSVIFFMTVTIGS